MRLRSPSATTGNGLTTSQSAAKKDYVPWSVIKEVIAHCPTDEWKLLLALIRSVTTRGPSEIEELAWSDVDWPENTILIHSPKTRVIGKFARKVSIFESLKPCLEKAFDHAHEGELYVFPKLRQDTNPGTYAKKIVVKAKQSLWANFFNSIRASAETDLMDQYGLRRACQWAGNSPTTAMKNYALTRNTDFVDDGNEGSRSDAVTASTTEQKSYEKSTQEN